MTQGEVAKHLGVRAQTVSRYETGQVIPSVPVVLQMLHLFGCRFEDLIEEA